MNLSARQMYFEHFSKRLFERYGMIATNLLYNDIIRQIQNSNISTKVKEVNRQRSIHAVWFRGKQIYVVYRKGRSALVTALPPNKKYKIMYEDEKKLAKSFIDKNRNEIQCQV